MESNNLKKLQEEDEKQFFNTHNMGIQHNVEGSLILLRFIGQLVEMYIPKMLSTFLNLSNGEASSKDEPTS